MHRTQVLLEGEQYEQLKAESARSGRSIGELIRAAVDRAYRRDPAERVAALRKARGAWAERDDIGDGVAYVDRLPPGMAARLAELDQR